VQKTEDLAMLEALTCLLQACKEALSAITSEPGGRQLSIYSVTPDGEVTLCARAMREGVAEMLRKAIEMGELPVPSKIDRLRMILESAVGDDVYWKPVVLRQWALLGRQGLDVDSHEVGFVFDASGEEFVGMVNLKE